MHPKLCLILSLLSVLTTSVTLAQYHQAPPPARVNVVLEKSCWTSASCRREFKTRYNGRVTTVQLRVPWDVMYPTFHGTLIQDAAQDLQTISPFVEPLYIFKNEVQMHHLQRIAHDLTVLNWPYSAFLLDSTDAKENLAVITRELSIIHTVFRRQPSQTQFYNIPPKSFLSTKHLHKYLRFVQKHVTGIRIQLNNDDYEDGTVPLETLDEMLTVISNSSLVPEVEAKNSSQHLEILAQLTKHHITVFQSVAKEDLDTLRRFRRAPPTKDPIFLFNSHEEEDNTKHHQGQLAKLFPSLKVPSLTWNERRASAKRNLEKLFDKWAPKKFNPHAKPVIAQSVPEVKKSIKFITPELTRDEKVFLSSDNPRFPKEDVTVVMMDRRGDGKGKDYDYVEYTGDGTPLANKGKLRIASASVSPPVNRKKDAIVELSEEEEERFVRKKKPSVGTAVKDLELWEMESQPKVSISQDVNNNRHHRYQEEAKDVDQQKLYSDYQRTAFDYDDADGPYGLMNYTGDSFNYPQKKKKNHRTRRDIFSDTQPIEGAMQGIFQDIRDYYPKMLERLASAVRPKRDEELLAQPPKIIAPDTNHIENLLEGVSHDLEGVFVRKTRSSPFIRSDPETNEIGYKIPQPVTLRPIAVKDSSKDESSVKSFLSLFLARWHALQDQIRGIFK